MDGVYLERSLAHVQLAEPIASLRSRPSGDHARARLKAQGEQDWAVLQSEVVGSKMFRVLLGVTRYNMTCSLSKTLSHISSMHTIRR